jgi:hypothetical protein
MTQRYTYARRADGLFNLLRDGQVIGKAETKLAARRYVDDKNGPQQTDVASWGWALAIIMPIIGFVLGAIVTATRRDQAGQGVAIMILSVVMTIVWAAVLR